MAQTLILALSLAACTGTPDKDISNDTTADDSGSPSAEEVTVRRDAWGVPHIVAETDEGAMYGLGWASAGDRLFQMNYTAYAYQGRLAELHGTDWDAVEYDTSQRLTGKWRQAVTTAQSLDADTLALLEAYAEGVNDWMEAHPEERHALFDELGMVEQTWTPAHCIAAWRRLGHFFTSSTGLDKAGPWQEFVYNEGRYGTEAAIDAYWDSLGGKPGAGDSSAGVVQESDVAEELVQEIQAYAQAHGYGEAGVQPYPSPYATPKMSHAWAVGSERSVTGSAILANNGQASVQWPGVLYEFRMSSENFEVHGASAPGSPGAAFGMSAAVAWALTAGGADQADLFALDTEGLEENQYRYDGEVLEMTVEAETIEVRDGDPVTVHFRTTVWGPVVTALVDDAQDTEFALHAYPMVETDQDTVEGMLDMMRADSMEAFIDAVAGWRFPVLNAVAASAEGDIYYGLIGAVPLRDTSSPLGGLIAQDGASSESAWVDVIPFAYMPQVLNPASGVLASANHRPAGDWYPLPLYQGSNSLGHTSRSRRLVELLSEQDSYTGEDVLGILSDCVDPNRRDVVTIGRHIAQTAPGTLSESAVSTLTKLEIWYEGGASMGIDEEAMWLASKVDSMFRSGTIPDSLFEAYGGGNNGFNYFCSAITTAIAADSTVVLNEDVAGFVDTVLSEALADASATAEENWSQKAANSAHKSLYYMVSPELWLMGNPAILTDEVLDVGPFDCATGNTVNNQPGQTISLWVDYADLASAGTLIPPGNTEATGESSTASIDMWLDGSQKSAFPDLESTADWAESEESLIFSQGG